jgi:dCTP deaminase
MIKSDRWIIRMCRERRMIEPCEDRQVKMVDGKPVISYGVSSYGYDIRVGRHFKILDPARLRISSPLVGKEARSAGGGDVVGVLPPSQPSPTRGGGVFIDPKNFDVRRFCDFEGDVCVIPPHGMAIAQSLEYFRIPREVLVICSGKSTYSRCGVLVSIAPLEPEWEGRLTFSITNTTALPAKVYAEEGIAQILFLESDEVCQTSYADKQGKYQRQTAFTPPKV